MVDLVACDRALSRDGSDQGIINSLAYGHDVFDNVTLLPFRCSQFPPKVVELSRSFARFQLCVVALGRAQVQRHPPRPDAAPKRLATVGPIHRPHRRRPQALVARCPARGGH